VFIISRGKKGTQMKSRTSSGWDIHISSDIALRLLGSLYTALVGGDAIDLTRMELLMREHVSSMSESALPL
jgi:hypothetical protein